MHRARAFVTIALAPLAFAMACSTRGDAPPPPTIAERCERSCSPPASASHPCVNAKADPTCQSQCESTLEGKSDACASCFFSRAGWQGTTCECSSVFGASVTCKECTNRGGSRTCSTELVGGCTDGAKSCAGWKTFA